MNTIKRTKYFIPAVHILVWALLLAVPAVLTSGINVNTGLPSHFFLLTNLYHIGLFYFNAYYLYPKLMNRKYWWSYFPAIAVIIIVSGLLKQYFVRLADPGFVCTGFNCRVIFFAAIPFLVASFIFRLVVNRIHEDKMKREAEAERLASELKFLRSQVSPHFLFNMMANMVALARQKSDLLEPALIKLSGLLRYMLYEKDEEKFILAREMEYLESYIELQQLRFGEGLDLRLLKEVDEKSGARHIEPMLLLPFVENAFKHGIGLVESPFIKIFLSMKETGLFFSVSNNYNPDNSSKDKNSGIGLQNVKNRLKLLYPGKYSLNIRDNGEIYKAELKLDLSC